MQVPDARLHRLHDNVNGTFAKKRGGKMVFSQQLQQHIVLALKVCRNYVHIQKCVHNVHVKIFDTQYAVIHNLLYRQMIFEFGLINTHIVSNFSILPIYFLFHSKLVFTNTEM